MLDFSKSQSYKNKKKRLIRNGTVQRLCFGGGLWIVAVSGPTIWRSTYVLESTHCNRLLVEPSCWAQTVHMFTLRLYVSRDLTVTPCADCSHLCACIYDLAESCMGSFYE